VLGSKIHKAATAGDIEGLLRYLGSESAKERAEAVDSFAASELAPWRERVVRALCLAAQDPEKDVRERALIALGALKASEAQPLFMGALADPAWSIRVLGCTALCEIEDRQAVRRLQELLQDDVWLVRMQAAWSLGKLAEPDDTRTLDLLSDVESSDQVGEVRRVARYALHSLREKGSPRTS
jgi:HEAT repeat protein